MSQRVTYPVVSPYLWAPASGELEVGLRCSHSLAFSKISFSTKCCGQLQCSYTVSQWQNLCCISQHSWWMFLCIHRTQHQSWHCQCLQAEIAWIQNQQAVQRSCHHLWVGGQYSSNEWCFNERHFSPGSLQVQLCVCFMHKVIAVCQWPWQRSKWMF